MPQTTPLTPRDIALIEEQRIATVFSEAADEAMPLSGGVVTYAGPADFANTAVAVGLSEPAGDDEADAILDFHTRHGVDSRVECSPFTAKPLVLALSKRGYTIRMFENIFAIDLALAPPAVFRAPEIPGLDIRLIDTADAHEVERFARLAISGFLTPEQSMEDMLPITMRFARLPRARSFIATIDDIPVAAGGLEIHEHIATLYGVTVLPEYRNRGIQQAIIAHRLRHARETSVRLVTIGTEPGIPTERNAIRAGFSIAYTKVVLSRKRDATA
ncbi:MAG: N-acetyltransferase [Phycisphaeraceae bacterium]|nr:MAG: N-acetyltransferase [Phycisphaeraceae bacterium]